MNNKEIDISDLIEQRSLLRRLGVSESGFAILFWIFNLFSFLVLSYVWLTFKIPIFNSFQFLSEKQLFIFLVVYSSVSILKLYCLFSHVLIARSDMIKIENDKDKAHKELKGSFVLIVFFLVITSFKLVSLEGGFGIKFSEMFDSILNLQLVFWGVLTSMAVHIFYALWDCKTSILLNNYEISKKFKKET